MDDEAFIRETIRIHDRYIWPAVLTVDDNADAGPVVHALLTAAMNICLKMERHNEKADEIFTQGAIAVLYRAAIEKKRYRMNAPSGPGGTVN